MKRPTVTHADGTPIAFSYPLIKSDGVTFERVARGTAMEIVGTLAIDGRVYRRSREISVEQLAASTSGRDAEIERVEGEIGDAISAMVRI